MPSEERPAETQTTPKPLPSLTSAFNAFEPFDLEFGEVSDHGLSFIPFKLVRGYPFTFVGKANQESVCIAQQKPSLVFVDVNLGRRILQGDTTREPRLGLVRITSSNTSYIGWGDAYMQSQFLSG
jgi:hypothetical protein